MQLAHDGYGDAVLFPQLVLVAMLLLAGTLSRTGRFGAILLAVVSAVWLLVNQRFEGNILWVASSTHALTAGDLVGLAGILLAIWHWYDSANKPPQR